jgi:tetratricopeptide (TPR) repeat protein
MEHMRLPGNGIGFLGSGRLRTPFKAALILLAIALLSASCLGSRRIVRIPVTPQDIMRANEAAKEADLYFARRDFYAALIKYLEAGRLNPNSEFIYNKIGITYSQLKFYTEAGSAFYRCIGLNPKYPYPYNNLGSVYFALDDKKKAEKYFKRAISMSPKVASFHINLGSLYFEKKDFDRGLAELRLGLSLDPNVLNRAEAISLAASGSPDAATERNYLMARLYASVGDAQKAIDSLQLALNTGFTDLDAILKEPDFDPIRNDPKFQDFMKNATLILRPPMQVPGIKG